MGILKCPWSRRKVRVTLVSTGLSMRMMRCTAFVAMVLVSSVAGAQYPDKPIRIVVPMQAGSVTDNIVRTIAPRLAQRLGQPVLVENKPGADGAIAGQFVARSAPDGYTLMMGTNSPLTGVPSLRKSPPYDTLADFTPICFLGMFTHFLLVNANMPAKNLTELLEDARANPGKLNYATGHTAALIYGAQLKSLGRVDIVQVPYKGEPEAVIDLVSGRVQMMFTSPTTSVNFIKEGKLRALGVVLNRRSPLLPEVPTMIEAGLPGFANVSWAALVGPAKMPKEIVAQLNRELNAVLKLPEVREKIERQGLEISGGTPEELGAILKEQLEVWRRALREVGIQPE